MISWIEIREKFFEGWADGDLCYIVAEDADGWYWEEAGSSYGYGGFDTAEEAQRDAERAEAMKNPSWDCGWTATELRQIADEIYGDMVYEERKERGL